MADTQIRDLGVLWERTLTAVRGYSRTDPGANPTALRTLAADAQRLLAAGNPYARIAELEAQVARAQGDIDESSAGQRRAPRQRGAA
mgnify:FL=1